MRIVDWNIEHMNSWFVPNNDPNSPSLRNSFPGGDFGGGQIDNVQDLATRTANVLLSLDPDVICIQEGAGEDEVAFFLEEFIPLPNGQTWVVFGGSGGSQKLITAIRIGRNVSNAARADDSTMTTQLNDEYEADTDGDAILEPDTKFARVPLVVDIISHEKAIRVINCHFKSKFVRNGRSLFNGTQAERLEFISASLINRRRISAEAYRIRTYLDELFAADANRLILLAGDLNDGPGFDFFERRYLTHSVVDLVFGSVLIPEGRLSNPLIQAGQDRPASAFFDDFIENIQNKPLLIDHIGLSQEFSRWHIDARVANTEFDAQKNTTTSNERERLPSDHRPLFAELIPPS